ncbi:MAG: ABC transporter ATP-binding protein [Burkholderiaceae bacterium]|nr:ABC transporter ATP-binding protein [Burkholderiaceae bacterium]
MTALASEAPWAIDVHGLTKRYGARAVVDRVDLQVRAGRICGFLGPNGSGKTTTIRMLCGLLTPDGGAGTCLGLDIRQQAAAIKRQVGYMTQRFGWYEDLSIRQNLDFVARLFEVPARKAAVSAALEQLGLTARQHQLAGALSGGWKQRLALAACLLHQPRLLLLDEPTAGVDPAARRDFWDQIHALAAQGITILVSTHYMDEAERCHELAYIAYGRLLARGTEAEIIRAAGLSVFEVTGDLPPTRMAALRAAAGVQGVTAFGARLHVTGSAAGPLREAVAPLATLPGVHVGPTQPSLEDVFIHLIGQAQDNFAGAQEGRAS